MTALTHREQIAYDMIREAAYLQKPCPSNLDIAVAIDCESLATPPRLLKRLEAKGLIHVERYQCGRTVTLADNGRRTRPTDTTPHWRPGVTC